jgi:hypothetical protein
MNLNPFFVFLSSLTLAFPAVAAGTNADTVDVAQFGAKSGDQSDTTPAVRAALDQVKKTHAHRLVFAPGRYDFWPDRASERYEFITNNDEGLKRIVFPLENFKNLEIDGQGAQFVFHGFLNPFILDHTDHVTLKNFSIDFARTFSSEAKILAVHGDSVDISIPEQFPYKIDHGLLTFVGLGKDKDTVYPVDSILEFDPVKRETAFEVVDIWHGPHFEVTEIGPRELNLKLDHPQATPGNVFVFAAAHRRVPGIVISDCTDTVLQGVTVYHAGGMAVVSQRSRNITLDHVQVTPTPNSGRVLSTSADATHFSNCSGKILMTNCLFECQDDDATNIHGIYEQVTQKLGPDEIEVELVHPQQFGFNFIKPGMHLEFVHSGNLVTYASGQVKSVDYLNKEYAHVTFTKPLPADLTIKDVVAQTDAYPDVEINHCTIRGNRARGFLIGSRGKVVIEDNYFHTAGAAILFEGDGRFWFEQSGVRDVTIRGNTFDNCNYGTWGKATIEVGTGMEKTAFDPRRYHRNIDIENNTFHRFDPRLIYAYSVDGLTFHNNKITDSHDYTPLDPNAKAFTIFDCDHVTIDNN